MDFWNETTIYSDKDVVEFSNKLYYSKKDSNINNLPTDNNFWQLYIDPIVQIYYALWDLLEAHQPLANLVKIGNRIKMSGDKRDAMKKEVGESDLPELRLLPVSSTPHTQRTSNTSSIIKRFRIEISTGDQRVDMGLFIIEWEIFRALANWAPTLQALTWEGKKYVVLARPTAEKDGFSQKDLARGIKSWSSVWECEIELWFTTTDLI